jgi:hypothetical protein
VRQRIVDKQRGQRECWHHPGGYHSLR